MRPLRGRTRRRATPSRELPLDFPTNHADWYVVGTAMELAETAAGLMAPTRRSASRR